MLILFIYLIAVALSVAFFAWSFVRYLDPPRPAARTPEAAPAAAAQESPALIGLEAQFLVAPELALTQARELLGESERELARILTEGMTDSREQFEELLALLTRQTAAADSRR